MEIPWVKVVGDGGQTPAIKSSLAEKSTIIGRVGIILLSCGTGAWRVRDSMNTIARILGVACSADIGLVTIEYTCFDEHQSITHSLSLPSSGVNTDKLAEMESFVKAFEKEGAFFSINEVHDTLDKIMGKKTNYKPFIQGMAAALACSAFVFLLGGGPIEMLCSFFGAGLGNWLRATLNSKHMTLFAGLAAGVAVAAAATSGERLIGATGDWRSENTYLLRSLLLLQLLQLLCQLFLEVRHRAADL